MNAFKDKEASKSDQDLGDLLLKYVAYVPNLMGILLIFVMCGSDYQVLEEQRITDRPNNCTLRIKESQA